MKYKVLIGIIFIYAVIIGIIFFIIEFNKLEIIIYPDIVIEKRNGKWSQKELNQNKQYNIYINNQFSYKSTITNYDGEIRINGNTVYDYIASNKEIKLINYQLKDMTTEETDEILSLANIKEKNVTANEKLDIDYDHDGKIETIYFVSNSYKENKDTLLYSLIYVKDDVSEFIARNKYYSQKDAHVCTLAGIMDINNDQKYEFIIRCPGFDNSGVRVQIYESINKKLKKTIEV